MSTKNNKHKETAPTAPIVTETPPAAVASVAQACQLRKVGPSRWVVEIFENSYDAEGNLIGTKLAKSTNPRSWEFALGDWRSWSGRCVLDGYKGA